MPTPDSSAVSEPLREREPSGRMDTREPPPVFPHPAPYVPRQQHLVHETFYLDMDYRDKTDYTGIEEHLFTAKNAEAQWSSVEESFFIKKAKREQDEIDISKLPPEIQKRFTAPGWI